MRGRGMGARVTVSAGGTKMIREVFGVTGYLSQSDPRAHFGLGRTERADLVEIRWPGGKRTSLKNVPANQILQVVEDEG